MSKFKVGDLVRLLDGSKPAYLGWVREGMVGEITRYQGKFTCMPENARYDYWEVALKGETLEVAEPCLRLIPGGSESRQRGSWDVLPWSPYRVSEEAVARAVSEATARLRLAVKCLPIENTQGKL